jgi:hypothetical protein
MSSAADLRDFAKQRLASIASRSGRILYSAAATLRPGPIYLLGLNPGGDPATHHDTVAQSLNELPSRTFNAYIDESWAGQPLGCSRLQRRVRWLLERLGLNVREVCAANLIFVRSSNSTGSGYPTTAELCWPVHEHILRIVQPRAIVAFGNSGVSPFRFLQAHYGAQTLASFPSGHGTWSCFGFTAPTGIKVVGLPHLSRYAINKHPEVVGWLQRYAAL